jgi:glycosyltransferase involved in cell wall biosynthesis
MNGNRQMAELEEGAARRGEDREDAVLRDFDRVYVCSEVDRASLRPRARAELCILPNAVRLPQPSAAGPRQIPFTFLFVGSLGYYPNEDAAIYFCQEVLPLLRRQARSPFRCVIVGTGAREAVTGLGRLPEVEVVGAVPDVGPWYREANVVVVPIRAGGGTRIKILEAFSYRRPVVTTSVGIEGIDAQDGVHVLIGDTPAAMARRCLRLMDEPELVGRLSHHAFLLLQRSYTIEAVTATFLATFQSPG